MTIQNNQKLFCIVNFNLKSLAASAYKRSFTRLRHLLTQTAFHPAGKTS